MKYWLNLYTWTTWQEFLKSGGTVTGFKERRWKTVQRIKPGDFFLCYLTGVSRFFAIQEVTGEPYMDNKRIWQEALFPCRVPVTVRFHLEPEFAVPVLSLQSELSYFRDMKTPHSWTGYFRGSPLEIHPEDARFIIGALESARDTPNMQPFDSRDLERRVPVYETKSGPVSIPDDSESEEADAQAIISVSHEEIQWLLLQLGQKLGFELWIANNDRGKSYNGKRWSTPSFLE